MTDEHGREAEPASGIWWRVPANLRGEIADRMASIGGRALVVGGAVIPLDFWITHLDQPRRLVPAAIAMLFGALTIAAQRAGRGGLGGTLLLTAFFGAVLSGMILNGGVRAPVFLALPLLSYPVAALFGLRVAAASVGVIGAVGALFVGLERHGALPATAELPSAQYVVVGCAFAVVATGFAAMTIGLVTSALERSRRDQRLAEAAEARRREQDQRLRLALHAVGLTTWSEPIAATTGGTLPEAAAAAVMRSLPDARGLPGAAAIATALAAGGWTMVHRNGAPDDRWFESRARLESAADGAARVVGLTVDVTARIAAEADLRRERDFAASLVEVVGALVVILDRDGAIQRFNAACERATGLREDEVRGRAYWEVLVPAEQLDGVRATYARLLAGTAPVAHENDWVARDGSRRRIAWRSVAQRGADGAFERLIGTGIDVTDERRARALLEATQRAAEVGGFEYDVRTGALHWTDEMFRLHDLEPGSTPPTLDALGRRNPHGIAAFRSAVERAAASGRGFDELTTVVTARGRSLTCRCVGVVEVEAGEAVRAIGALQDLTPQLDARNRLRERERTLHLAMDAARIATIDRDLVSGERTWSANLEAVLGLPAGSYCGTADEDRMLRAPEFRDAARSLDDAIARGDDAWHLVQRLATPGGERWIDERAAIVRDDAGRAVRIAGVVVDVTDRVLADRRANERLEGLVVERTAELSVANRELEAFAYSVSHDLRSPVRSIGGFAQALEEDHGAALPAPARADLAVIRDECRRMGRIIDDLLRLSQVGRATLAPARVDVSAMAEAVLGELRRAEPDRAMAIEIQLGVVAEADPGLLRVALENLLGNAWKFTRRRDAPRIALSAARVAGALAIAIDDNGAGFDPRYADKLFRPFQRLHSASDFPGSGIGLATVRRVAERHRGRISAHALDGGGARFVLELPDGGDAP